MSQLQDQFRDVAYVEANNPWMGEPWIKISLDCYSYPPGSSNYDCAGRNKQFLSQYDSRDLSFSGGRNSIKANAYRYTDSKDYIEFGMYISQAPLGCTSEDTCATDCTF